MNNAFIHSYPGWYYLALEKQLGVFQNLREGLKGDLFLFQN